MKMTWLEFKHYLMIGVRWAIGLFGVIALYLLAGRVSRQEKKAQRAGEKYWETSTDTIKDGWRGAEKHQKSHEKAQDKARKAKETARKVRDAVANENTTLDDLFHEYNSKRLPGTEDTT